MRFSFREMKRVPIDNLESSPVEKRKRQSSVIDGCLKNGPDVCLIMALIPKDFNLRFMRFGQKHTIKNM